MYAAPPALNLVVIRSADIDRSNALYAAIGLVMRRETHGSGPMHYVAAGSGLTFEIYPLTAGQTPTTNTRLGFQVNSVDEVVSAWLGAGGTIITRPNDIDDGRHAVLADLDGHRIELFTPKRGHRVGVYLAEQA